MPGTPGLEHRIGGLEKADGTGDISYDADNHEFMVRVRQAKVDGIARDLPPLTVDDPGGDARVLVLGWGSTAGPIAAACDAVRARDARSPGPICGTSTPFPRTSGTSSRPTTGSWCPR